MLNSPFRRILVVLAVLLGLALALAEKSRESVKYESTSVQERPAVKYKEFPALAMVALNNSELPSGENIVEWLRTKFKDLPSITDLRDDKKLLSLKIGGVQAYIGLIAVPIPWRDLEGPCATAWWWPNAAQTMKKHKSHAIIYLATSKDDAIFKCMLLSRIVASVAASSDTAGVYWGNGTLVYPAEMLVEATKEMSRKEMPLNLWIDFRIEKNANGSIEAFTTGLEAFSHLEIEVHDSKTPARELLPIVSSAAEYLLLNGPVLKDGDTFGRSETERIRVRHARSRWDKNKTVIVLEL